MNPIPFVPFPLIRGRGISYIREAKPLLDCLSFTNDVDNV